MPKTRNAFAFRNFDETRILQRPYFRQFNLPNQADTDILKLLQATADDDVDAMENKLSTLKALHERVQDFINLINRYCDRARKLTRLLLNAGKIKPPVLTPPSDYLNAIFYTKDLLGNIAQNYYALEKKIQKKYRAEFTARLRHYLDESGLTRRKLGDLVQVSPQSMSKYFLGQNEMPIHTLIRISKILGVSTDKLLGLG